MTFQSLDWEAGTYIPGLQLPSIKQTVDSKCLGHLVSAYYYLMNLSTDTRAAVVHSSRAHACGAKLLRSWVRFPPGATLLIFLNKKIMLSCAA